MPDGAGGAYGRCFNPGPGDLSAWVSAHLGRQIVCDPGVAPALDAAGQLTSSASGPPNGGADAPLVPQLLAKAEGNPFFLEELARTVVEQGADASSPTVPDTVQAVLTARMDRLPATAKRLLQTAAVIGKDVALPLLQAVTEVSEEAIHDDLQGPAGR